MSNVGLMAFVYKPKRFFFATSEVCVQFLLLIPMLIDNNENVALLNCYIKFVGHQMGE